MNKGHILSQLPSVEEVLNHIEIVELLRSVPRRVVVNEIRHHIDQIRKKVLSLQDKDLKDYSINEGMLVERVIRSTKKFMGMSLKEVVNGTGVVLHTNLGRALLSSYIKDEVWSVASGYSTLEMDVETGKRGSRYSHVIDILKFLTGAEDALVVNNNAAAVMLVLGAMCKNKEVVVSRGQLVEIGGSFRVPDVMEESGAKLVDVGTTNKTHLWDYEKAIGENTAALLKVHTSNYKILGFTHEVPLQELVSLSKKYNVPLIEDLGSGVLVDLRKYGLSYEPTVQESVSLGVDVVTFSGDKLLGGPQAGIIVGKKEWIEKMKKNPLTRAFRVDKLTMAALEATLKLYLDEEEAMEKIPTLRMLTESVESLTQRITTFYGYLKELNIPGMDFEIRDDFSQVGGGSMPLEKLPTKVVVLRSTSISTAKLETRLRNYDIPVFGRVQEDEYILDIRTIMEGQYSIIGQALQAIGN